MKLKFMISEALAGKQRLDFHSSKEIFCLTEMALVVLGLLLCPHLFVPATSQADETLERIGAIKPMKMSEMKTVSAGRVPSIDVSAPSMTKTATFAMG
jgi:hypothetical protein